VADGRDGGSRSSDAARTQWQAHHALGDDRSRLAIWAVAVAWPGMQVAILVLSGALVAWAAFGLLTDQ
jgi:hypothetical protein